MSYKAALNMKPVLVFITMSANQSMSSGDTVAFDTLDGSSSHGVTIFNNVVTVPSGYQWFCQAQVASNTITTVNVNWYINNSVSTTFQNTGITTTTSTSATSNSVAHCALDASSSSVSVELRADASFSVESDFSFMILIGYPS